jgi:hypothetical protein
MANFCLGRVNGLFLDSAHCAHCRTYLRNETGPTSRACPPRRTRHENLVDPSTRDRGCRRRGDGVGATADVAAEAGGGHRHPRHPRQGPRPPFRPCHRRRLPPPRRHRESFLSLLLPLNENLLASLDLVASV